MNTVPLKVAAAAALVYPLQTVPAGEISALIFALRNALPGVEFASDCKMVVEGVKKGKEWCTAAHRSYADLWQEVWTAIEDRGETPIVRKVKAHATRKLVDAGEVEYCDYRGNAIADRYAKNGADMHPSSAPADARCDRTDKVVLPYAHWIAKIARKEDDDVERKPKRTRGPKLKRIKTNRRVAHDPSYDPCAGLWRCIVCGRAERSLSHVSRTNCRGDIWLRKHIDDREVPGGHVLWTRGPYVWCTKCGGYSRQRVQLLGLSCRSKITASAEQ